MVKKAAQLKTARRRSITKLQSSIASQTMRGIIIQAIEDSGKSVRSIALNAGISQPQLSRFVKGERDLLLEAADRVARSLGLGLRKIDD